MLDIEGNYEKFKQYVSAYITRDGDVSEFLNWLDSTDFKTAPASSKYNLSVPGGLCKHSLDVFFRLIKLIQAENIEDYSKDTIALVSLLHDISKVNRYKIYEKNVKNPDTGAWEKEMAYTVRPDDELLIYGTQEENSVYILRHFFTMNQCEENALLHINGAWDADDAKSKAILSTSYRANKLAALLSMAEFMTVFIDENEKKGNIMNDYFFDIAEDGE